MISQANRHPGHAAWPSTCPVEASRPRIVKEPFTYFTYINLRVQLFCVQIPIKCVFEAFRMHFMGCNTVFD